MEPTNQFHYCTNQINDICIQFRLGTAAIEEAMLDVIYTVTQKQMGQLDCKTTKFNKIM